MKTYIKIAWRNLWRNKRRSLITIASIFFGVMLSALMSSMQEGSYESMVDIIVKFYSGSMQVHKNGYWENQSINNVFINSDTIKNALDKTTEIQAYSPRIESFALASSDKTSKGISVLGIDPEKENAITGLKTKMIAGNYLRSGDKGIMMAQGLADFLGLKLNDTLVLIGQGYHDVSAAGKYAVTGIIKHPNPEFNKMIVYMNIKECQYLYQAENMLTSYVILIENVKKITHVKNMLAKSLPESFEVMSWADMNKLMIRQINSDRQSGRVMLFILYLVIGFGILGTIMMMMSERKKEFGVMIAVGMQKYKLKIILMIETIFIGLTGVISGIIVSIPIIWFLHLKPIPITGDTAKYMEDFGMEAVIYFSMIPFIFINQAIIVLVLTLGISIYPIRNIGKLKVMNALKG